VPPEVTARILLDALDAIAHAHDNGVFFGDLAADSILITTRGQVVVLPTCSRADTASDEDDVAALGRLAGMRSVPLTARLLAYQLRRQRAIAEPDFVGRFVSQVFTEIASVTAPPPQLILLPPRISDYDDVPTALPIELRHSSVLQELIADELISIEIEKPAIPIYVEEPIRPARHRASGRVRRRDGGF
jgi:hypothetical protein